MKIQSLSEMNFILLIHSFVKMRLDLEANLRLKVLLICKSDLELKLQVLILKNVFKQSNELFYTLNKLFYAFLKTVLTIYQLQTLFFFQCQTFDRDFVLWLCIKGEGCV